MTIKIIDDNFSIAQTHNAVRAVGYVVVVRYHDNGFARRVEFVQNIQNFGSRARVQVTGRFVCQEHDRVAGERARDGDALLLTTGKFKRTVEETVFQTHQGRFFFGNLPRFLFGNVLVIQGDFNVFEHVELGDQVVRLENESQFSGANQRKVAIGQLRNVLAIQKYCPCVGRSRHPKIFSRVDFPEPDGPMITTYSPRSTPD